MEDTLFIAGLPVLTRSDVDEEELCAICLVPFEEYFADSEKGVTKLEGCGHIFCRQEWVTIILVRLLR